MSLAWRESIDLYCERTDASFWSEPVNALSNLAFFAAAWWVWRSAGKLDAPERLVRRLLAVLIALIGAGSLAFHTFGERWSALADVLAIALYIYVFLGAFLRHAAGLGWAWVAAGLVAFWLLGRGLAEVVPPSSFNGSAGYLPAAIGLATMAAWLAVMRRPETLRFGAALGVFLVSLVFRSVDQTFCSDFPPGTHWLWHLLNALVLALLATGLLPRRG